MSESFVTIHVRDTTRAKVARAIDARMAKRGYERVVEPSGKEPNVVRVALVAQGRWMSMTVEELDSPDVWAKVLSKASGGYALGVIHWDGESTTSLVLFEGGKKVGELGLPSDARRIDRRKIAVPLGKLSRLVGDGSRQDGLELRVPVENDLEEDFVYVSLSDASYAFRRAFGLESLGLEIEVEDEDDVLTYRSKHAEEEEAAENDLALARWRAAYDARVYAIGWIAFEHEPKTLPELLERTARRLADTFTPHLGTDTLEGWSVDPAKSFASTKISPPDSDHAWHQYAELLARGVMIDLHRPHRVLASVCIAQHDGALAISWSMRGLRDERRRREIASVMDDVVCTSAADGRCFGALLTAQKAPLVLEQRALAYEYLRGRSGAALRPTWLRAHARAPGFRVLVPRASESVGKPPNGFTVRKVESGRLISSNAADPWSVTPTELDSLEEYLAPSLGTYKQP